MELRRDGVDVGHQFVIARPAELEEHGGGGGAIGRPAVRRAIVEDARLLRVDPADADRGRQRGQPYEEDDSGLLQHVAQSLRRIWR